jgi:proteic killer suppression protein
MIRAFKDARTQELFLGRKHRDFANIASVALRKLDAIHTALALDDLKEPPGNRLEALKGDRVGEYSIRINDQFRICFVWKRDGAYEVEITDYH